MPRRLPTAAPTRSAEPQEGASAPGGWGRSLRRAIARFAEPPLAEMLDASEPAAIHPRARVRRGDGILTREQVIDRILAINPTAAPDFLNRFGAEHLRLYLDHLVSAQQPRGRDARWVRPRETPAIVVSPLPA